jgi:ribosomal protein S18 acetylase RimI-like enzyme
MWNFTNLIEKTSSPQKGHVMNIRALRVTDQSFLWDLLYQAIFVPPDTPPPPRDIVFDPKLSQYVEQFGQWTGDYGVVAEDEKRCVGAAWVRLIEGYGFVDALTPELTIAVYPDYQGRGIGTQLLKRLCADLKGSVAQISLSVTWINPARRLYERLGFELMTLQEGTATMKKHL